MEASDWSNAQQEVEGDGLIRAVISHMPCPGEDTYMELGE